VLKNGVADLAAQSGSTTAPTAQGASAQMNGSSYQSSTVGQSTPAAQPQNQPALTPRNQQGTQPMQNGNSSPAVPRQ
jgi:hypothetical protein